MVSEYLGNADFYVIHLENHDAFWVYKKFVRILL